MISYCITQTKQNGSLGIVVVIDTSHFTELNKLDLATKYGAETLDGFSNMNLLESLNVDKAFNVLTASDGQD